MVSRALVRTGREWLKACGQERITQGQHMISQEPRWWMHGYPIAQTVYELRRLLPTLQGMTAAHGALGLHFFCSVVSG